MLLTHYWWCVGQMLFTLYWWCVGQMTKHHKNKFPVVIPLQKYFYNLYRILFRMSLERFQMRALQRLVINETTGVFALELHEQNSFHQMFKMSAAALSTYVSKWQKLFKNMVFWTFFCFSYFPETLVPITFPRPSNVRIKREANRYFSNKQTTHILK